MSKKKEPWVVILIAMACLSLYQGVQCYRSYNRYKNAIVIPFTQLEEVGLLERKDGVFIKITTLEGKKYLLDDPPFINGSLAMDHARSIIKQKEVVYKHQDVYFSESGFPYLRLLYLIVTILLMVYFFGLWLWHRKS